MKNYTLKIILYLIAILMSALVVAYGNYYQDIKYLIYSGFILVSVVLYLILLEVSKINDKIK